MKDEIAGQIEEQYRAGLSYMRQMGYLIKWPECERFKAGDQWPKATKATANLPRPVFNIARYISNHKVSSVMNENVKMLYSASESGPEDDPASQLAEEAADKYTKNADVTWDRVKQDELNEEALESGSTTGTGIWHYYWDVSQKGGKIRPWIGDMVGEVLDPINVFWGNPQERRVQRQPYVIISLRDTVASIRKEAQQNGVSVEKRNLITPDKDVQDEGYDQAKVEVRDTDKATVLLKYWRADDGLIHFMKVCSSVVVKPDTSTGMELYPLVVMQWERRRKSIHGVGDIEGIIPNQKAINVLIAMEILSVQLTGWPKMLVNRNVVDPAKVNNEPGGMIVDSSPPGQGDGVKYLNPGNVSPLANALVEQLVDYTKMLSSAQDAATGDMSKGQLNATAIMLLQKAAGVPIESIKKRFYRAMEDVGQIWAEFWRVKFNTTRSVMFKDDDGQEIPDTFNGSAYRDAELNLKVDIGPSSQYSEELMMASLDKLFDGQHISLEDYLEFAPKNVVPFKDRLLKRIEQAKQEQAQMQANMPPDQQQQDQMQQQIAMKQMDHQHQLELQQQKGQIELQKAAMSGRQ
ncbi:portal protein [Gorillibacterium timonense]|uniref:portal protein n=1 Tax=Gorillibacterium timonense TaxID=1689269 RepID=UPI00071C2C0E|nr:hypothetical protein [Gorillibacterium timonense]